MEQLSLIFDIPTYSVMCIACYENREVDNEPATKQLSFFVCKECRGDAITGEQLEFDCAT